MCSWCWGISNEFEKLKENFKNEFEPYILMGGLRPGVSDKMDKSMRDFLRHHWKEVNLRTGQPFNYAILEKDSDFVYDTEIPSRAVIIVREMRPDSAFEFFKEIQKAFYVQNKNTNLTDTYLDILIDFQIDTDKFQQKFKTEEYRNKSYQDFQIARQMGVTGFPTVVLGYEKQLFALSIGYSSFTKMKDRLEKITEEQSV